MIEMVLAHVDLARVRLAYSPIRELAGSLLVLQDPGRQVMQGGWVSTLPRRLGGLQLELLTALVPAGRYVPSFLLPPPTGPRTISMCMPPSASASRISPSARRRA
jgi:hypothetical protein